MFGHQSPGVFVGLVAERKPAVPKRGANGQMESGVHMVTIVSGPAFDKFVFYCSPVAKEGEQPWFDHVPQVGEGVRLTYVLQAQAIGTLRQGKPQSQLTVKPKVIAAEAVGRDALSAPPSLQAGDHSGRTAPPLGRSRAA